MKIVFGEIHSKPLQENDLSSLFEASSLKQKELSLLSIEEILLTLDGFSHFWKSHPELKMKALKGLDHEMPFSYEMMSATLDIIPELFKRENLELRLKGEFNNYKVLDQWSKSPSGVGKIKAFPLGQILHVTAGNVFISCIDSLLMGFLTKNISYLKLSSKNQFFPYFFAETFFLYDQKKVLADKFCIFSWKGGDQKFEVPFKHQVQGIIAWGGEEMLKSLKEHLPLDVKIFDYGPKISFQVVTKLGIDKMGLSKTASLIAKDLIMWDQQACSSPQNLFYEEGIDLKALFEELKKFLDDPLFPRGRLGADESVELLKEKEKARYDHLMKLGLRLEGETYLLHAEPEDYLRTSPLNRTLIFKKFHSFSHLVNQVKPFRFYLQSCGYQTGAFEKNTLLTQLALAGVKRFSPLGSMSEGHPGLPHDGRYGLVELVQFVTDEVVLDEDSLMVHLKSHVPFYKDLKGEKIADLPLTSSITLRDYPLTSSSQLKSTIHQAGRFFASGGSTGKPKHVFYSNEDWLETMKAFAFVFKAQGLQKGELVANLFASGSLYSSFLAVDRYSEELELAQLPIGGLTKIDEIVEILLNFKPTAIFGLPSLIMMYAEYCEKNKIDLKIEKILFAGEHFYENQKKYLIKTFKTKKFISAGYATVDAGMIGYQCAKAMPGVHHLLDQHLKMEIIENEAVVTSFMRDGMPVVRYQTGDHVEWVKDQCTCGSESPQFKLLGRLDSQFNLWSCRLFLSDLERAIKEILGDLPQYQVQLKTKGTQEILELKISLNLSKENLMDHFFEASHDMKKTISKEYLSEHFVIEISSETDFLHNPRTGKVSPLIDLRSV